MMCTNILSNIGEIKELCESTQLKNKLALAVSLYLECDFIIHAITALSIFTNKIILPMLNFVAKTTQKEFVKKIETIYNSLNSCDLEILKEYSSPFEKHLPATNDVVNHLLQLFCKASAKVLQR